MTRSYGGPGSQPEGSARDSDQQQQPSDPDQPAVQPARIELGKRMVAIVIDIFVCYMVAAAVSLIPFIRDFLQLQAVMIITFVCRDYLFEGRGIGKNLMGFQVVDLNTGQPCSLLQSVERNIVIVAPYVVLTVFDSAEHLVPIPWINESVRNLIQFVGMIYCAVVIPLEGFRVYSREDGLRIGDDIASTGFVESHMDFSKIVPRQ